jgi:serine/threonine protein phosphatase PrpC
MPYIIISGCALLALLILRVAVIGRVGPGSDLEIAHAQLTGRREINADVFNWSVRDGKTLLALADGIGTGTRGRTAALAASDSVTRTFELQGLLGNPAYFFRHAFQSANESALFYVPDGTAGVSLLCALISEGTLYYALAGNCKAAVLRAGALIPLSEGQTLDVLALGAFKRQEIRREDAKAAYMERRVYNYVGRDNFRELEMFDAPVRLRRGDCVVLMTHGVFGFCPELDLERILLSRHSVRRKAQDVTQLLQSLDHPEQDNATIVLAKVRGRL